MFPSNLEGGTSFLFSAQSVFLIRRGPFIRDTLGVYGIVSTNITLRKEEVSKSVT